MIVLDASALVAALLDGAAVGKAARAVLADDPTWFAPAHIHAEVLSAVRGLVAGGKVSAADALVALDRLARMTISIVPSLPLLRPAFVHRHNVSAYDALYVVAADALGCALVTADARLRRAVGDRVVVHLV